MNDLGLAYFAVLAGTTGTLFVVLHWAAWRR